VGFYANGQYGAEYPSTGYYNDEFGNIYVNGSQLTLNGTRVHDSAYGSGIATWNESAGSDYQPFLVTLASNEIDNNFKDGILVIEANRTTSNANLIVATSAKIHDNGKATVSLGGRGVNMVGYEFDYDTQSPPFQVSMTLQGGDVYNNGLSGLYFGSSYGDAFETVQNSDIHANNTLKNTAEAGIWFNSSSSLTGFTGNKLHSNYGPEIRFSYDQYDDYGDTDTGGHWTQAWDITPLTDACDDTANQIYCYNVVGDGEVGVWATNVRVNSRWVHWKTVSPSGGTDWSTGTYMDPGTTSTTCSAVLTCP
jgi:hypothetical protein